MADPLHEDEDSPARDCPTDTDRVLFLITDRVHVLPSLHKKKMAGEKDGERGMEVHKCMYRLYQKDPPGRDVLLSEATAFGFR